MTSPTVKLEVDQAAGVAYLQLADVPVSRTAEFSPEILVDVDTYGMVVGLEFLALPVMTLALETRLTPNEAAELLGISHPFLLDLIARGHINAESLPGSRHRVLRLADVLAFQADRERRGEARRAIMKIVEDENPPY